MTITSNAVLGYTVTATSSGFLINPATGYYIPNFNGNPTNNNTPAPSEGTAANGYGIHPCDPQSYAATHVFKTLWYNAGKDKPKYANPSSSFYYTLVNYVGTLGNENVPTTGKDIFTIIYRVNPAVSTPPGDYWQIMTYNVSATF